MHDYRMHIGGEWVSAASGETFETVNPFDGKPWPASPGAGRRMPTPPSRRRTEPFCWGRGAR